MNRVRSKAGRKAWKKHRKVWFVSEKKAVEELQNEGYEIVVYKKGYPDIMAYKDGKLCFFEVKLGKDHPSDKQRQVIRRLNDLRYGAKFLRYDKIKHIFVEEDAEVS